MLLRGDVVTQHQIHFTVLTSAAGDGGNGIMGFSLSFREDKGMVTLL